MFYLNEIFKSGNWGVTQNTSQIMFTGHMHENLPNDAQNLRLKHHFIKIP